MRTGRPRGGVFLCCCSSSPCLSRARSLPPCLSSLRYNSRRRRRRDEFSLQRSIGRSALVVVAAANDDAQSASTSTTPTPSNASSWRTCKHCKRRFDPRDNPVTACRRHPALFTGGEVSKAIGFCREGPGSDNWLDAVVGTSGLMRFWDCCGAAEEDAPGCFVGPHEGF